MAHGYAVVAELADALDSGSSGVTAVEVRVLSTASRIEKQCISRPKLMHCFFADWPLSGHEFG
jgi:hypothetical protein